MSERGGPFTTDSFNWMVKRAGKKAGFPTMTLVAYRHGLRASEVCDLRWEQIDFNSATRRLRFVAPFWISMLALLASAIGAENGGPCRPVTYERNSYVVCHFDLRHYTPKPFWKQPNGEPYGSLKNIPRRDGSAAGQLVFATNGGMYQTDRSPLGLYIENGRELIRANTAVGAGNFYIRPERNFLCQR